MGTAAALVPVKSITMKSRNEKFGYGDGSHEPGPACLKLLTTLQGIQLGKVKDEFGWCDRVEEPKRWDGGNVGMKKNGAARGVVAEADHLS